MKEGYNNRGLMSRDKQIGGSHYKELKIQPVDYITANNIPYREGNVIKYVTRHRSKKGLEDIKKAIHYLEMIKEEYERENEKTLTNICCTKCGQLFMFGAPKECDCEKV